MDLAYATLISVVLAGGCVLVHYEVVNVLARFAREHRSHRTSLILVVYGLLGAHVIEIWLYGLGYAFADRWLEIGHFIAMSEDLFDYGYFSAMVYTTVGFGDIIPTGGLRMIASSEAVVGLAMITWSASLTFLHMQRLWRDY